MPESAVDYVQRRYAALVTMTDHWFGTLINKLKELDMYEDTMVVMTTDHGYFLGERDYLGKNFTMNWRICRSSSNSRMASVRASMCSRSRRTST